MQKIKRRKTPAPVHIPYTFIALMLLLLSSGLIVLVGGVRLGREQAVQIEPFPSQNGLPLNQMVHKGPLYEYSKEVCDGMVLHDATTSYPNDVAVWIVGDEHNDKDPYDMKRALRTDACIQKLANFYQYLQEIGNQPRKNGLKIIFEGEFRGAQVDCKKKCPIFLLM